MNNHNWRMGAALLALLTTGTILRAADGDKAAARPEKGDKRERKAEVPKPDKRTLEHIEHLNGKALSDEQMKTVQSAWEKRDVARKAADDAFKAEIAQSLGLTPEQIAVKEKDLRQSARKENPDGPKKEGEAGAKREGEAGAKREGEARAKKEGEAGAKREGDKPAAP